MSRRGGNSSATRGALHSAAVKKDDSLSGTLEAHTPEPEEDERTKLVSLLDKYDEEAMQEFIDEAAAHAETKKQYNALHGLFVAEMKKKYADNREAKTEVLAQLERAFSRIFVLEDYGGAHKHLSPKSKVANSGRSVIDGTMLTNNLQDANGLTRLSRARSPNPPSSPIYYD
ncbi:hypothetical protein K458DRAFT_389921 [Lentithecium fluviatile CBS 122367]|uniref:Uncharacterized protein n=1 Tax=Lentithecium fluviatile CBS 122367 TaxID=1168545 RepID=A0A6G1IYI9_9PLEO|nr:hypothetical protein K458DRAFT_389921 [Lentithecium fluviatile CBS 122367]